MWELIRKVWWCQNKYTNMYLPNSWRIHYFLLRYWLEHKLRQIHNAPLTSMLFALIFAAYKICKLAKDIYHQRCRTRLLDILVTSAINIRIFSSYTFTARLFIPSYHRINYWCISQCHVKSGKHHRVFKDFRIYHVYIWCW